MSCSDYYGGVKVPTLYVFVVVGVWVPTVIGGDSGGGVPRCAADDGEPYSSLYSLSSLSSMSDDVFDDGSAAAAHRLPFSSTSIIGGSCPLSYLMPTCFRVIALITCGDTFQSGSKAV